MEQENIPCILRCYDVVAFSDHDGVIEFLDGFVSFHELKKTIKSYGFDGIGVGDE